MKRLVTSDQLAHLWAHQTQSEAHTAGNRFYFRDSSIFSYGGHFCIARHSIAPYKKTPVILFTTRGYSNTTAKHISHTRQAIRNHASEVVMMHDPSREPSDCDIDRMNVDLLEIIQGGLKCQAKNIQYAITRAESKHAETVHFSKLFKLRKVEPLKRTKGYAELLKRNEKLNDPESYSFKRREKARLSREALATQQRIHAEQIRVRKLELLTQIKPKIVACWRMGLHLMDQMTEQEKAPFIGFSNYDFNIRNFKEAYCVIRENEVVTSHGARVPVEHAKKAIEFIKALVSRGEKKGERVDSHNINTAGSCAPLRNFLYQKNGHTFHIGHYPLDVVYDNGDIQAGCHYFKYEEILHLENEIAHYVPLTQDEHIAKISGVNI